MVRTFGFWAKAVLVAAIARAVVATDVVPSGGLWWGGLAGALIGMVLITRWASWLNRTGLAAILASGAMAVVLFHDPGLLGWTLFWGALSVAVLSPRVARFDDALRWSGRLVRHTLSGPVAVPADLRRLMRVAGHRPHAHARPLMRLLAMPLIGTAVFVGLFALANPLIADTLAAVRLPGVDRTLGWLIAVLCLWPTVRPRAWVISGDEWRWARMRVGEASLPSVLLALGLFNLVFAVQNGLDLAFLWSGAPLPAGVSLADYAHRGAYPLIATALLAGGFVLTMLRPGTPTAASPLARWLVVGWVAQNVLLVASSALRTVDYVAALGLTEWRLAALAWMALVALGLVLIVVRLVAGLSGRWLINANALAALAVLMVGSVVDLSAAAATYNVAHAREGGGDGAPLDLCYLSRAGDSSVLPLIALEARPLSPALRQQVVRLRSDAVAALRRDQADWQGWSWRGARRLAEADRRLGLAPATPAALKPDQWVTCEGTVEQPDPPLVAPLSPPPPASTPD